MKSLVKICLFPVFFQYGTDIAKKPLFGIAIAKASVNGTIDNIQFPLFLGITIAKGPFTLSNSVAVSVSDAKIMGIAS